MGKTLYGKLNSTVKLFDIRGVSTDTARTDVDRYTAEIWVNVLKTPHQLTLKEHHDDGTTRIRTFNGSSDVVLDTHSYIIKAIGPEVYALFRDGVQIGTPISTKCVDDATLIWFDEQGQILENPYISLKLDGQEVATCDLSDIKDSLVAEITRAQEAEQAISQELATTAQAIRQELDTTAQTLNQNITEVSQTLTQNINTVAQQSSQGIATLQETKEDVADRKTLAETITTFTFNDNCEVTYTESILNNLTLNIPSDISQGFISLLTLTNMNLNLDITINNESSYDTRIVVGTEVIDGNTYQTSLQGKKIIFARCDGHDIEILIIEEFKK